MPEVAAPSVALVVADLIDPDPALPLQWIAGRDALSDDPGTIAPTVRQAIRSST